MLRLTAILLLTLAAARASACTFPPPVRERTSNPADGEVAVPTSTRVRVTYATGAHGELQCGAKPPAPILRLATASVDGGVALDGGTGVTGSWIRATDVDPHYGVVWEFRPTGALPSSTSLELVDTFPAVCDCTFGPCKATPTAVFARFTTGAGPDTTKPTFGGLIGTSCFHAVCGPSDDQCCGPYDHYDYTFEDKRDQADDHLVGLHLYVRSDGKAYDFTHPVAPLKLSDPVDAAVASAWDMALAPGKYFVLARAFDTSGNEDDNLVEVPFVFPLRADPLCAALPVSDGGVDMQGVSDYGVTPPVDMATAPKPGGCSCAIGGATAHRPLGALVLCLIVIGLRARRRRRPGSPLENS